MNSERTLLPSISVVACGALWGLYWIPIRELDEIGVSPIWANFLTLGVVGIFFSFAFLIQWIRTQRMPGEIIVTGIFSGIAVIFYASGVGLTEVVKVVLLFYLMPVWTALLGKLLLRETITKFRVVAIVLGLAGLAVILGIDNGIPRPSNLGDWIALLSGMCWAYASVRIRRDIKAKVWEQVGAFYIGAVIASAVFILLPTEAFGHAPSIDSILAGKEWLAVFVIAYFPSMFLLFWANQKLSPTRVGILLMSEIIFGVVSAATLSGEPFGWTHGIGVVLIMGAAIIDTLAQPASSPRGAND